MMVIISIINFRKERFKIMTTCSVCGIKVGFSPYRVNDGYICNACLKSLGLNTLIIGVESLIKDPAPVLELFTFDELKELIANGKKIDSRAYNKDKRDKNRMFQNGAETYDGASINFKTGQISKNSFYTNQVQEMLLLRDLKSYEVISNDSVMNNHKGSKVVASGIAFGIVGAIAAHGLVNRDGAQFLDKLNIKIRVGNSNITIRLVDKLHSVQFGTSDYYNEMRTVEYLTGKFDKLIEDNGFNVPMSEMKNLPKKSKTFVPEKEVIDKTKYIIGEHPDVAKTSKPKNKFLAAVLGLCFGCLGVHNFYLGFKTKAILQLLGSTLGWFTMGFIPAIVLIWAFSESVLILISKDDSKWNKDADGVQLLN